MANSAGLKDRIPNGMDAVNLAMQAAGPNRGWSWATNNDGLDTHGCWTQKK